MPRLLKSATHQVLAQLPTVPGSAGVKALAVVAGMVLFRADAAFYAAEVVAACRRAGDHFSLTVRLNPTIHAAIATIDEDAWIPGDGEVDRAAFAGLRVAVWVFATAST